MASLSELAGSGWTPVEPPEPMDGESVVARYQGEPIKAGFLTERVKDTQDEVHFRYRSGQFDLDVKIDFSIGRGQVRVEEADGYDRPSGE
jgi:hypothetical protein